MDEGKKRRHGACSTPVQGSILEELALPREATGEFLEMIKKRNILNLLFVSVGKSISTDFSFSLQVVKDRLAAGASCFAFGLLIAENTSRKQQCVLILKWLNAAMLPSLQMR